jgi:vacuolar-type H+-ATPase subunit F/Vma7
MNVDIEKISAIKNELEALKENDALFINEEGKTRYAIIPIETYDALEDLMAMINPSAVPQVKIVPSGELDLSYDEYERIKKQIMDAVEKTFMPKPEKLN